MNMESVMWVLLSIASKWLSCNRSPILKTNVELKNNRGKWYQKQYYTCNKHARVNYIVYTNVRIFMLKIVVHVKTVIESKWNDS